MLDVHAPEHGIHGGRDFFLHLFTITCGLLIALGLEASVEAMHHRHQRQEAEEKIRQEIRTNAETLKKDEAGVLAERETMQGFIRLLRLTTQGEAVERKPIKLDFSEEEIPDAAWRTASSTGVLEYMPYDEVENFANAYREQALLQSMAQKALEDYLELAPPFNPSDTGVPQRPTKAEMESAAQALPLAMRAWGHLNGIMAAGNGTMGSYEEALK